MGQAQDLHAVGARVEELLAQLRSGDDPRVADRAEELVRLLMELYGAGLERVVALVGREPGGGGINRRLAQDELLASLFVLHELHPVPLEDRVAEALESASLSGATFLGLDDEGTAHFELEGGTGCGSHTSQFAIEKAVLAVAPEVVGVAFEAPPPPPGYRDGIKREKARMNNRWKKRIATEITRNAY